MPPKFLFWAIRDETMGIFIEIRDVSRGPGLQGGKILHSVEKKKAKMNYIGCLLLHKEPLQEAAA